MIEIETHDARERNWQRKCSSFVFCQFHRSFVLILFFFCLHSIIWSHLLPRWLKNKQPFVCFYFSFHPIHNLTLLNKYFQSDRRHASFHLASMIFVFLYAAVYYCCRHWFCFRHFLSLMCLMCGCFCFVLRTSLPQFWSVKNSFQTQKKKRLTTDYKLRQIKFLTNGQESERKIHKSFDDLFCYKKNCNIFDKRKTRFVECGASARWKSVLIRFCLWIFDYFVHNIQSNRWTQYILTCIWTFHVLQLYL